MGFAGQPEDLGDHGDRKDGGEVRDQIGVGRAGEPIDEFRGHLGHPGVELVDRARGETLRHQLPVLRVRRRVDDDHRRRLHRIGHFRVGPVQQLLNRFRHPHPSRRGDAEPLVPQDFPSDLVVDGDPDERGLHQWAASTDLLHQRIRVDAFAVAGDERAHRIARAALKRHERLRYGMQRHPAGPQSDAHNALLVGTDNYGETVRHRYVHCLAGLDG